MAVAAKQNADEFVSTPSARTLFAELLLLCARIGYSPHLSV
jgi:hypothetical protein